MKQRAAEMRTRFQIRDDRRVLVRASAELAMSLEVAGGPGRPVDIRFYHDGWPVDGRTPVGLLIDPRDRDHLLRAAAAEPTGVFVRLEVEESWLVRPVTIQERRTAMIAPTGDDAVPERDLDRIELWDLFSDRQLDLASERAIALGEAA